MKGDIHPLEFMARREEWDLGISLYARQVYEGHKTHVAQAMVMEEIEDGALHTVPFIRIDIEQGQQLIDELWRCGLRPSEGSGSTGMLKSTQDHLADMRTIVFKQLNLEDK